MSPVAPKPGHDELGKCHHEAVVFARRLSPKSTAMNMRNRAGVRTTR